MKHLKLAQLLHDLVDNWARQDRELADARSGLAPEYRTNEKEEDARIAASRDQQVRWMVEGVTKA